MYNTEDEADTLGPVLYCLVHIVQEHLRCAKYGRPTLRKVGSTTLHMVLGDMRKQLEAKGFHYCLLHILFSVNRFLACFSLLETGDTYKIK